MNSPLNRLLPFLAMVLAALPQDTSAADAFAGKDFSLRFSAALNHFDPYADVVAKGGSSAALPFGSSNNPASIAWFFPDGPGEGGKAVHYTANVSEQYSNVSFDNGSQLHFISGSVTLSGNELGVFRLDAGLITSNERAVDNLPADFDFDLGGVRLNYAKKLGDEVSLGASAGFARSDTTFSAQSFDLADATENLWNFRLGALWNPAKSDWFLGVASTYIYGPTDTTTLTPLPTGGLLRHSSSDATQQFTVQPGIAYRWRHLGFVHVDYEFARFSDSTGSLKENRFLGGLDIPLTEWFYLRAGAFTDASGHAGWSTGVGIYAIKHVLIDLAYQNGNFPEIAGEFGRSRTLNASVSIQW